MPLDILILNPQGKVSKLLPLYIDEYDIIFELIDNVTGFDILKRVLSNYYGDNEVYLNELESFKAEVVKLKYQLQNSSSENARKFINDLLANIEYAILNKRTIKIVGD